MHNSSDIFQVPLHEGFIPIWQQDPREISIWINICRLISSCFGQILHLPSKTWCIETNNLTSFGEFTLKLRILLMMITLIIKICLWTGYNFHWAQSVCRRGKETRISSCRSCVTRKLIKVLTVLRTAHIIFGKDFTYNLQGA